jgi:ParB family chromosome partitioning protein
MSGLGNKGLGRGFGALIPTDFDNSVLLNEDERIQKLPLTKLVPNQDQPRQYFDEEALNELAESIRQHGVLLPLVVTASGDKYHIIAGERRFRAAKLARLDTVPAIVRTLKEIEQLEIALIENVQRVDLSPLEQAASIERLHGQFNVSYNDIAKRLGKAPSTINNIVRLIQLPIDAQNALRDHAITEGHARMILSLKDSPDKQEHLLNAIIKDGWSVRMAERYVTSLKEGAKTEAAAKARVSTETPATKQLAKRLGAPVHLRRTAKGGKLEIGFKDDADLERITKLFATE